MIAWLGTRPQGGTVPLTMVSEDFHSLYLVSSILGPWLMEVFTKVLRDLRVAGLWTSLLKKSRKRRELPSPLPGSAIQTYGSELTVYISLEVGKGSKVSLSRSRGA